MAGKEVLTLVPTHLTKNSCNDKPANVKIKQIKMKLELNLKCRNTFIVCNMLRYNIFTWFIFSSERKIEEQIESLACECVHNFLEKTIWLRKLLAETKTIKKQE